MTGKQVLLHLYLKKVEKIPWIITGQYPVLTCISCKIMESIVHNKLVEYFSLNNLFSNKQYGFIKGRSTVLQLLKISNDWTNLLENGGQIDVIYTDLEKAFNKVSHQRLLSKLHSYGINSVLISWIKYFLCSRVQRVKL